MLTNTKRELVRLFVTLSRLTNLTIQPNILTFSYTFSGIQKGQTSFQGLGSERALPKTFQMITFKNELVAKFTLFFKSENRLCVESTPCGRRPMDLTP